MGLLDPDPHFWITEPWTRIHKKYPDPYYFIKDAKKQKNLNILFININELVPIGKHIFFNDHKNVQLGSGSVINWASRIRIHKNYLWIWNTGCNRKSQPFRGLDSLYFDNFISF